MTRVVQVTTGSRLHFGLWGLQGSGERDYGGVGAMIEQPAISLTISPADGFGARGIHSERAAEFARRWAAFHGHKAPVCAILVTDAPPQHTGLGTGSQLALAVAAGLNAFFGLPKQNAVELALSVGRGQRSAVGVHGFLHGGLIVDQGKRMAEPLAPLDCRIEVPSDWRFLLARPLDCAGLAGDEESLAMASLPPVPFETTNRLIAEVRDHLVPAAATGDFALFSASLYRYGHASGAYFAERQGGPFNGPVLTNLVETIRNLGIEGVGQSSWGPTIFAVMPDETQARNAVDSLHGSWKGAELDVLVTAPLSRGARVELLGDISPS